MADPLSALLSSKKKEEQAKPAAPKQSLFASSGSTSAATGISSDLTDVTAALGGARRNVGPGPPPFERTSSPSTAAAPQRTKSAVESAPPTSLFAPTSLFEPPERAKTTPASATTEAAVAPPSPPRAESSALVGGLNAAVSQLHSGTAPSPAVSGQAFDDMLDAEKVFVTAKKCFLKVSNPLCEVQGRILCTNYRVKFQSVKGGLREELKWMSDVKYFDVPMGTIQEIKVDSKETITGAMEYNMKVLAKDLRVLHFLMASEEECREVIGAVQSFGQPGNPTLLFAVKHCEEYRKKNPLVQESDGWSLYDPMQEYSRMGVDTDIIPNPSCPWKVSPLNTRYELCSTYPSVLVLPRHMSDQDIRAVAAFRKRGRLPALSWCGGPDTEYAYASVWRCSQTTEGLMGSKCPEDEKHVQCIRQSLRSSKDRDLLVIDLRPWKAAWANKAGGGGFENYQRCNLDFGGIDNIHCVRDAWRAMGVAVTNVVDGEVGSWMKDVANSSWYDYIGAIMNCALKVVVEIVQNKSNVMVHCSDGWDRTAQTTSLAMLCLDPNYRTQSGFLKLIQKEWCAFGHKFRTRMALGEAPTSESSPVFLQWLEAVYQVVVQFPNHFEFTPAVLLRLATEVSSNRFGTFLTDCERERNQSVAAHSLSLWSLLLSPVEVDSWKNPSYRLHPRPLFPSVSQASYSVWEAYWFRYHPRGAKLRPVQAPVSRSLPQPALDTQVAKASGPAPDMHATPAPAPAAPSEPRLDRAPSPSGLPSSSLPPLDGPVVSQARERAPNTSAPTADKSLFAAEEIVPKAKPKTFFQDDDDDDDSIFSPKSK